MVHTFEWRQGTDAKSGRRHLKNVWQEDLFDNRTKYSNMAYMYSDISKDSSFEEFDVGTGLSHLLTPSVDFSIVV